jgi:hypothetical protein
MYDKLTYRKIYDKFYLVTNGLILEKKCKLNEKKNI